MYIMEESIKRAYALYLVYEESHMLGMPIMSIHLFGNIHTMYTDTL